MKNLSEDDPLVSICCITYNHESYIEDAIKGFINQKTDFNFEVLIHDDASTDGTAEIIKKYEAEYPDIIKPIYQVENQYSKGININHIYNYSRAKGKYIALCEGDDYWKDLFKLQKQIDYMQKNYECTFCFTNGKIIDEQNKEKNRVFVPFSKENEIYFHNENREYDVGSLGLLGFIPSASFIFRKSILKDLPEFYFKNYPAGDLKIKLYATSKGYAYFINDVTTIYRTNVNGSLMSKWKKYNNEQLIKHNQLYVDLINDVDKYTNSHYTRDLNKLKINFEARQLVLKKEKKLLKDKRYKEWFKKKTIFNQIKIISSIYSPNMYKFLKHIIKR